MRIRFWTKLAYILKPFWHHRGISFWFHFGQNSLFNDRFKFGIHLGVILGEPNGSKIVPQIGRKIYPKTDPQNGAKKQSFSKSAYLSVSSDFCVTPLPDLPLFCIVQWSGPPRSVNSASASRRPPTLSACERGFLEFIFIFLPLYVLFMLLQIPFSFVPLRY